MSTSASVTDVIRADADVRPACPASSGIEADRVAPTVITARSQWRLIDLAEVWRYRELLYFLAWRDVKVRYKQTVLGIAWVVLQPLAYMVVFTFFVNHATGAESAGLPYPLFVLSGLLPWIFFSGAVSASAQSLVGNQSLITKVYFPRVMVPMSAVGAGLVDLLISLLLLAAMAIAFQVWPSISVLLLPVLIGMLVISAMGIGILLSALTATYRDFRHIVPFMIQLWMFATPAIYLPSADTALAGSRWWLPLNPAQGLILNFRAAALGLPMDVYALSVSSAVALGLALLGCLYFRRVERSFADVL